MKTTLNEIKSKHPCADGWEKLLKHLGKTGADDEELDLMVILKSNGIEDAIWALRCFDYGEYCLFLADIAESVLDIYEKNNDSPAPRNAIRAVRDYKACGITKEKLKAAADAAAAAFSAAYAAYAACAADAAFSAACAAAYADAAFSAAYADAAFSAAYAAYAACAAADAAAAAFSAADAAAAAARRKKWQEIEKLFIKHFGGE